MNSDKTFFLEQMKEIIQTKYEVFIEHGILSFVMPEIGISQSEIFGNLLFFNEDCGIPNKSTGMLQIFITVGKYNRANKKALSERIVELNSQIVIGHFSLVEEPEHICYRYTVPVMDLNDRLYLELASLSLDKMIAILNGVFNYLLIIADDVNEITFENYIEEMKNLEEVMKDPEAVNEILSNMSDE
ncbi:MAG: hypothetical protein IJA12_02580 [Oscillospiraceae bacterium]|nr:hypothetical protein [Oscillospiraceae bacterium]